MKIWNEAGAEKQEHALKQARPAVERIASKEAYLFETSGGPLEIRCNYLTRELEKDSFGEILIERADIDWHISISIKSNARVLSSFKVADRTTYTENGTLFKFNEIDDFGERIFSIPCSNEYFTDMNEILLTFSKYSEEEWMAKLKEDSFRYGKFITPILKAMGNEMSRICEFNQEAPKMLIEYFYGKYDYYFFNPIEELKLTRIGAVNSHGNLGKIPNSHHLSINRVKFPTQLLDVRFATGQYGELLPDTLQFCFDKGWALCVKIKFDENHVEDRNFLLSVFMPVTPFGSYRDQVAWK